MPGETPEEVLVSLRAQLLRLQHDYAAAMARLSELGETLTYWTRIQTAEPLHLTQGPLNPLLQLNPEDEEALGDDLPVGEYTGDMLYWDADDESWQILEIPVDEQASDYVLMITGRVDEDEEDNGNAPRWEKVQEFECPE
jgi:hypothetical protein